MTVNKNNKQQLKSLKKHQIRNEKNMSNVADLLETFSVSGPKKRKASGPDDYDFDEDYEMSD